MCPYQKKSLINAKIKMTLGVTEWFIIVHLRSSKKINFVPHFITSWDARLRSGFRALYKISGHLGFVATVLNYSGLATILK